MSRVYLDHNATTPLRPEARGAMIAAMDVAGNPSSVHGEGRKARALVERARVKLAEALGCNANEIIFTSGATEAALVLSSGAEVAETAHDCMWAHHMPGAALKAKGYANNETGLIDDSEGANLLDIVQAVGKVPFSFAWSGADMAIVSAHKFGGPKGVGALVLRDGLDIPPLARGGGQEQSRRAGTENTVGIAGMAAAAEAAVADLAAGKWARVESLRNGMEAALKAAAPDVIVFGEGETRLPNTSNFAVPGWKGETQVMQMDLAGFAVSAGSACSSGKVRPSRVLRAMGFDDVTASSALRVSLGLETTETDIARFCDAWLAEYARFKARAA
ncbi:MAG: cysteine desulfurase family protein [Paracoccaceae bacterium]